MIYSTFLQGDIYLSETVNGYTCKLCGLTNGCADYHMESLKSVHDHLVEHRRQGDLVPDTAFEKVERELRRKIS